MTAITPSEATAIAKNAYIFTYPLVASYRAMCSEAADPSSTSYNGGFGKWLHQRTTTTTESATIATCTATLRSSAWLDLRAEPWVVSTPTLGSGCSGLTRTYDLWTFLIAETGACESDEVADSTNVLLASPTWLGDFDDHIGHVARGDSGFVHCEALIYCDDPCDEAQISEIQRRYTLEPLSAHVDRRSGPSPDVIPGSVDVETSTSYWATANAALALTTPNDQDRAMLSRIADIGVISGEPWDA
ncbi:MAG: DUF1254 domain-containing protein, partial [Acidimicrobiales bacterium]